MVQRDYLVSQIEQFGRVLGKLITRLAGIKNSNSIMQSVAEMEEPQIEELNADINELISKDVVTFLNTIPANISKQPKYYETLADIMFTLAEQPACDEVRRNRLYRCSLAIYNHLNEIDDTYSIFRQHRIELIQNMIN